MRRASVAAVVLSSLLAPHLLSGPACRAGAQQPASPPNPGQVPSAQRAPGAQAARAPREEHELQADLLMARKQYAEAAAIYQNLLRQQPRDAVWLNKLGIAYHQQTMLDLAKRCYERAAKADKSYAHAVNNIGTIYYQRKEYRKAIRAYQKAIRINPSMAVVHSNLGYAYFGQKHYEEAMQAFRRAVDLDPGVFDRGMHSGSLLQDRSVDDRGMFYFFLAKSFAATGNAERCAHYLRKARDEGYKGLAAAQTDPAFAGVLRDPVVQEVLQTISPPADQRPAPSGPPGA